MLLYVVIAHDDEGQPYVWSDDTDHISAMESAAECGGYVETIDTFTTEPKTEV